MKTIKLYGIALLWILCVAASGREAAAQTTREPQPPDPTSVTRVPQPEAAPPLLIERTQPDFDRFYWSSRHIAFRLGQDYVLRAGESVREVIAINSSATIEGFVRGDVTVVLGELKLGSTAIIGGSIISIGGNVTVQPGASVRQNALVVGGTFAGPPDFAPGHDHFVIGAAPIVERVRALVPWITEGLLLGRPIVPRLRWVWTIVFIVFVLSLAVNLIFLDAVRMCAQALATRPLSTFLVGLLVLLLTGPVSVVLAASIVGLAVVPFLLCAVVIAWTVGKVGVALWIGGSMMGQRVPETRVQALAAFVIGFALICIVYMVPLLGFVVWGLVGVLGLGAATVAFTSAYRRENPSRPKPSRTPPDQPRVSPEAAEPPPVDPVPPLDGFSGDRPPIGVTSSSNAAFFPRASFVERISAFALDLVLVLIINNAFRLANDDGGPIALLLAYHIVFWTWKGATVGDIILHLRVVRANGEPLRFGDALVRGLSSLFSIAVLGLGMLWILRDPERQAWHDKIAGTYVVKVPASYAFS